MARADSQTRNSWPTWGLLLSTIALGASSIALAWHQVGAARDAAAAIERGVAEATVRQLESRIRDTSGPPTDAVLAAFLEENAGSGLLYAAVIRGDGSVEASAGSTSETAFRFSRRLPPPRGSERRPGLGSAGPPNSRLDGPRFDRGRPRGRDRRPPPPGDGDRPPPRLREEALRPGPDGPPRRRREGREGPEERDRPIIVLELTSTVATGLVEQARRMLLLSAVSATLLTGITIAFWWLVGDRQRRARQFDEQRRLSALGEMSAVMAHEIRNPLASLKGHSQLLRERLPAGSGEHGKATRIVADVERLQTLVDGLLDFTRSGPLDRRATNPAVLVEQVLRELGDPRIELRGRSAPAEWSLDGPRFRQVVGNLLENALQADSEGGKVTVGLAERRGRLLLTVSDRGPGLPDGEGDRLFEPFVTTRAQGTGLGLAVVRRIVEMHGGTVTAENRPEGGAEFRVEIPR